MSGLKQAFAQARKEGSILPVFEPFMAARLHVIGMIGPDGTPNITLRTSPVEGRLCATVSERAAWFGDVPADRILPIRPIDLIHLLGADTDVVVTYPDGGDVLQAEHVAAFREASD